MKRRKRAALFGLLSSGLVVKLFVGAVAVAAVGSVAASAVRTDAVPPPVATTVVHRSTTLATTPDATASSDAGNTPAPPVAPATADDVDSQVAAAHEYAAAIQEWADCVSREASAHSGGPFDPHEACPFKPMLGKYGLDEPDNGTVPPGHDLDGPGNSENAPGQSDDGPGNSENAPGQSDDGPGNSENAPGKSKDRR
jgi:hypothetical protein